ncbi:MAG: UDP-N-acetylglucosamine--N-acetylmuramyl-(pentapeptide) pyrophosphoryl-undecaprenol N-acetylglucosamine transferase [Acidimicrobiia bacterium]|nr:UDP-N-acetylglucosamine--N-acetylmuramyl-(pentapeptide) pyrophosphoryl-undecaprenol N-acetylglucosamine transferase [Acidimicrobiia bacterium]
MTARSVDVVITGGGTGGHVTPALAIADALVAGGHAVSTIRFIGAARGLEAQAVPAAGYDIELLTLDGVQRSLRPRAILRSVRALLAFVGACWHCIRRFRRTPPAVVVGVGGYASAPAVLAARVLRLPTVVHEQNAVPGVVNRVAVRCGARPATSFPVAQWPTATMTGNPVRHAIRSVDRRPSAPPLVAIVGGSLGAGRLNDVGLGLYDVWRDRSDVAVRHVAGTRNIDECRTRLAGLARSTDRLQYELVEFETDMASLYTHASLMVCRSGATTVAELAAVGIASVLVPWSGSAEGQQLANAHALADVGAAVVVGDEECTVDRVAPLVSELVADPDRRHAMGAAARALGRPDAHVRLVRLIEEAAHGSR